MLVTLNLYPMMLGWREIQQKFKTSSKTDWPH